MQITSASGFSQQLIQVLAEKKQSNEMIQDYCLENYNQFNMISYAGDLPKLRAGEVLEFLVQPEEGFNLRPLEANGPTYFDDANISKICVQMCSPMQFGWKLDSELNAGYEDKVMQVFANKLDITMNNINKMFVRYIFNKMLTGASQFNTGNTAGKVSGNIRLGSAAAPLEIKTPASSANLNSVTETINLQWNNILRAVTSAANQQECDITGYRMIAHKEVNSFLQLAARMGACCDGEYTANGFSLAKKYFGFGAMFSNEIPLQRLDAKSFVTPIIFAHPESTLFHGGIDKFYSDDELWMRKFVGTVSYGGKVIRPNKVYVVWVKFTDENIV
jgi:hypothetical protein